MTLAKAANGCVVNLTRENKIATYNIYFTENGEDHCTQFCAECMADLKQLWIDFCEENYLDCTCVTGVEMVYCKEDEDEYGDKYYYE